MLLYTPGSCFQNVNTNCVYTFLRIAIYLRDKQHQGQRNTNPAAGANPGGAGGGRRRRGGRIPREHYWGMGKSQRTSFLHLILLYRKRSSKAKSTLLSRRTLRGVIHLYSPVYNLVSSRSKTSRGHWTAHPQLASGRGGGKATSHLQSCRARPGSDW